MDRNSDIHIVVVDDDPKVRALLRRCFEQDGYRVSEAKDGVEMQARLAEGPVSLITLDLGLPGTDGFTLARELRAKTDVPIIMVTGKDDAIDKVVGLELGADDYIAKPFHVRELLARVHSVLRRAGRAKHTSNPASDTSRVPSGRLMFQGWVLDIARRELRDPAGDIRELTTAEFNLLEIFLKNANRVLTRDDLMDKLKGRDWTPLDRAIDTQIARLRRKIEQDAETPRLIKTVRGVGYMFAVPVKRG
jgi:DNA-binding response OmpR family regulator